MFGLFWFAQFILLLMVAITAPAWLLLLWRIPKTRAGFFQKCGFWSSAQRKAIQAWQRQSQPNESEPTKTIWVHAVSVGEFLAIKPLVQRLLDQQFNIILSTTTLTGQQLAAEAFGSKAFVCYFPFDMVWAIDSFIKHLRPDAILLTETELWPTFVHRVAGHFGLPIFLINGRLSDQSFNRYLWIKPWVMQPLLRKLAGLMMQSAQDAQRVIALGALPERVEIWGNLKLDFPSPTLHEAEQVNPLASAWFFGDTAVPILTFASTHAGEERLFLEQTCAVLWQRFPQLKVVLAPRHPERRQVVEALLQELGIGYVRRSVLDEPLAQQPSVLLLDTVGELKSIFGWSTVAVVAGSFLPTLGGHNILEPIAMQTPTVFGPFMRNFSAITSLVLAAQAGIQVNSVEALTQTITLLLTDSNKKAALVQAGNAFLVANQGHTQRLVETLLQRIPAHRG
jgi:3-deoxy-D-manno-octulosonic-acid transferase